MVAGLLSAGQSRLEPNGSRKGVRKHSPFLHTQRDYLAGVVETGFLLEIQSPSTQPQVHLLKAFTWEKLEALASCGDLGSASLAAGVRTRGSDGGGGGEYECSINTHTLAPL